MRINKIVRKRKLKTVKKLPAPRMSLTHGVGIASAATLGYIAGNIPGAVAAGTAFHHFHKKTKENKMHEKMLK